MRSSRLEALFNFLLLLSSAVANKEKQYLYRTIPNDGGSPIIDYYSPESNEHPDFIFQEDFPYHRVVEYYSHLCPHCQRFAPRYIEFGRKFEELTQKHSKGHYANLEVTFYAVSCFAHREICKQAKIRSYPSVKIFKANSNEGITLPYFELHPETLVKKLGIEAVDDNWKAAGEPESKGEGQQLPATAAPQPEAQTQQPAGEKPAFLPRKSTELFGDAYLSFHTSMKTGVFLDDSNKLEDDKLGALQAWLTLLQRVLPPWRIHSFLESLLGGPTKNFTASIETEATWMSILDKYPPRNTEYSPSCQLHESPYTCGLWTLFHIMTVGVVEFNAGIVNQDANRYVLQKMHVVTKTLRDFVEHFLLCDVCTQHFLQEYDTCAYNRCTRFPPEKLTGELKDWKQLPFWLLETHNGVNLRLQWELSPEEDKPAPALQQSVMWPPVDECPGCWMQGLGSVSAKSYNETMMYNFLRLTYWPEDTSSQKAKEDILHWQHSPSSRSHGKSTWTDKDHTTNLDESLSSGDQLSTNLSVISKEVQYSMILMTLVVVVVWNKRIRRKLAARTA